MNHPIAVRQPDAPAAPSQIRLEQLVELVTQTVASPATADAYAADLDDWRIWCEDFGEDPTLPTFRTVSSYTRRLAELGASKATIRRRVAAIRKLARVGAVLDAGDPQRRAALDSLSPDLLKINVGHTEERDKCALTPAQVERALDAWDGPTNLDARNKAMIAVLFCTGLRRSEAAALRWTDVDLKEGLITVRHGKGDKTRTVPVYGEKAQRALTTWWAILRLGREYVFPRMHKSDRIGEDAPITVNGVYYVVRETTKRTGETFAPHDARRTFITERLVMGATLADVQADAGHAQASTTLRYAQASEAKARKERGRLRYG